MCSRPVRNASSAGKLAAGFRGEQGATAERRDVHAEGAEEPDVAPALQMLAGRLPALVDRERAASGAAA